MKRALFAGGLAVCLALVSSEAFAQNGSARGRVVDDKGQGIADVKVVIEFQGGVNRKYETKTNKKGEYIQVGMPPGVYKFTANKEGYRPTFVETKVQLGDATQIPDIQMKAGAAAATGGGPSANEALQAQFKQAIADTEAGKLDEAEAAYKDMLAKSPNIPEVYQNLAYVYTRKKDWANAEASYLKALELRPSADLSGALARMYQESGQPDKALALMQKAASDPGDAKAQFNMGVVNLNAGKAEEAIGSFKAAIAADPALADAYFHLGTLMVGQNKIPDAVQYLEKFLSMNPTNAQNKATAEGLLAALKPKK